MESKSPAVARLKQSPGAKVYSYIRFSTAVQGEGDSERRQLMLAEGWAARNGLLIDTHLAVDRGKSGFKGENRKKGALKHFLDAIDRGDIKQNSILLVENVDRLSREQPFDATEMILKILRSVTIITLDDYDSVEYWRDEKDSEKFLQLMEQIRSAHRESLKKSKRIRKARDEAFRLARESGKVVTRLAPFWLTLKPDQKGFEIIPEAAKTIAQIFELKRKGLGNYLIASKLNEDPDAWKPDADKKLKPKRQTTGWRASYLKKILRNRAVIGEYQPHVRRDGQRRAPVGDPIANYFPSVIKKGLFDKVQRILDKNKKTGGRIGKAKNLLTNLAKCAYCGGPMGLDDKGSKSKGGNYFVCNNGARKVKEAGEYMCRTPVHRTSYSEVENLILDSIPYLPLDRLLPEAAEVTKQRESLEESLASEQAKGSDLQAKIKNLQDLLEDETDKKRRNEWKARLSVREAESETSDKRISEIQHALDRVSHSEESLDNFRKQLIELKEKIRTPNSMELRVGLRSLLREQIAKIEVFGLGHRNEHDPDRETDQISKRVNELVPPLARKPEPPPKKRLSQKAYAELLKESESEYKRRVAEAESKLSPAERRERQSQLTSATWKVKHELALMAGDDLMHGLAGELSEHPNQDFVVRFIHWLRTERLSKSGRFIRIHFATGMWVDVVPPNSIGSGMKLDTTKKQTKGEGKRIPAWKEHSPTLEALTAMFDEHVATLSNNGKRVRKRKH